MSSENKDQDHNSCCPWCRSPIEGNIDVVVLDPCGHRTCTGCYFMNKSTTEHTCHVCKERVCGCTRTHLTAADGTRTTTRSFSNEGTAISVIPRYDVLDRKMKMIRTGDRGETPVQAHWLQNPEQGTYISVGFTTADGGPPAIAEHIIGGSDPNMATDEGDMFAFLGTVMRQSLLHADASSQLLPVYSIDGLLASTLDDSGPMIRFIHSLASKRSTAAGPPSVWDQNDRSTRRTTLGVIVSLEILRKLNCPSRRYPLHDYMATVLQSMKTPHAVKELLTRLVVSAEEKKDLTIYNTENFDPARAGVVGSARPFCYKHSLKLIDFDNMCLTSRGTELNFRQTVVMAMKEYTEDDLEQAGVFTDNPSMEPRPFNTTDVTENPIAEGAFYNADDVRILAARWKELLRSAIALYKTLPSSVFDTEVQQEEVGRIVTLADVKVPTSPGVQAHREVLLAESVVDLTKVTGFEEETTSVVDLYDSMAADQVPQASNMAEDQFTAANTTRTELIQQDLSRPGTVAFIADYTMHAAGKGSYENDAPSHELVHQVESKHPREMEVLSRRVHLGSDGSPKGAFGRLVDRERVLPESDQHRLHNISFHAGGFHTEKEVLCLNGEWGGEIFLRHMSEIVRNTDGKQRWIWNPTDPRHRGLEEPQYVMGLLVALVHETRLQDRSMNITWFEVNNYLMDLVDDPTHGPFVFLIVDYLRRADVAWMIRDGERQPSPYEGWMLFRSAHRLSMSIFAMSNAHIYFRFGVDDEIEWRQLSELEERVYGMFLAFSPTANQVKIYRDRWTECFVRCVRSIYGHQWMKGMDKRLASDVAQIASIMQIKRNVSKRKFDGLSAEEPEVPVSMETVDCAPAQQQHQPRGGFRERAISMELIHGARFALRHQIFRKGAMITKRGRKLLRMGRPGDGKPLNPQLLQQRWKGEAASKKYLEDFFPERPVVRAGEATGRFASIPPLLKDVHRIKDFHNTRVHTEDTTKIIEERMGNNPGWLFTCPSIAAQLENIRNAYPETHRGAIPNTDATKKMKKRELANLLVATRTALRGAGVCLKAVHLSCAAEGTRHAPKEVSIDRWPELEDRGDGRRGRPRDHPLITFDASIIESLRDGEDDAMILGNQENDDTLLEPTPPGEQEDVREEVFDIFRNR